MTVFFEAAGNLPIRSKMATFIAIVRKNHDGLSVEFPDFPGLVTSGRTFPEARNEAAILLRRRIGEMRAAQAAIPEPSSIESISARPEFRDGVATLVTDNDPADSGREPGFWNRR